METCGFGSQIALVLLNHPENRIMELVVVESAQE
jgi:hypothetical protein